MTANSKCIGGLTAAFLALAPIAAGSASASVPCEQLKALTLAHVAVVDAQVIESKALGSAEAGALPSYCRVKATSRPTPDSEIRMEIAIPLASAWNGKFLQLGNGGFAGVIPEWDFLPGLRTGFAVAATDDGHQGAVNDAKWAQGHPEKIIDYAYRSLKETTDAAKKIIAAYAGRRPKYSYFTGCSGGGREALVEAQRYPEDFNGILVGDPASNFIALIAGGAWNIQAAAASPESAVTASNKVAAIEAAALKACGDRDGVVENPLGCKFDPAQLRCAATETNQCLTDAQITTLRKIYGGAHNPRTGERILSGFEPGAEAEPGSWDLWGSEWGLAFGKNFLRYIVFNDPDYDILRFDLDRDFKMMSEKFSSTLDAVNPDLRKFKEHGGKLIQYHGWEDPAIPPRDSIAYFDSVQSKMGDTSNFYRLFMAPGMLHCAGGRGANPVAAPAMAALINWVEQGRAPDKLIVTKRVGNKPQGAIERTRPLCPYPRLARWDGTGDWNSVDSFRCAAPESHSSNID
jgi:Tannase and feruloyl esterase